MEIIVTEEVSLILKNYYLIGDKHKLSQVIRNLVSNALKFTPKGGNVRIEVQCVQEGGSTKEHSDYLKENESMVSSLHSRHNLEQPLHHLRRMGSSTRVRKLLHGLNRSRIGPSSLYGGATLMEKYLKVLVTDNGAGISEVQYKKLR